jgi:hypothetical protein
VRASTLVLAIVLAVPRLAAAFDVDAAAMQARASARGWQSERVTGPMGPEERWCPSPRCPGAYERSGGEVLVIVGSTAAPRVVTVRERRGEWLVELSIDVSVQTFGMRMVRGADEVRIGWETFIELPDGSSVHSPRTIAPGGDLTSWLRAELDAYLASPESFRARLALRDAELRAHVQRVIGVLTICPAPSDPARFQHIAGPDGAHGMADTCVHRALDERERGALLARLDAETGARARLARRHAADWHAALSAMLAR